MDNYYLLTFLPPNNKSVYFREGVGYEAGTQWVFKNTIPTSLSDCPHMRIEEIEEGKAFEYINRGVIYTLCYVNNHMGL